MLHHNPAIPTDASAIQASHLLLVGGRMTSTSTGTLGKVTSHWTHQSRMTQMRDTSIPPARSLYRPNYVQFSALHIWCLNAKYIALSDCKESPVLGAKFGVYWIYVHTNPLIESLLFMGADLVKRTSRLNSFLSKGPPGYLPKLSDIESFPVFNFFNGAN